MKTSVQARITLLQGSGRLNVLTVTSSLGTTLTSWKKKKGSLSVLNVGIPAQNSLKLKTARSVPTASRNIKNAMIVVVFIKICPQMTRGITSVKVAITKTTVPVTGAGA
jgi:hypothetical protein